MATSVKKKAIKVDLAPTNKFSQKLLKSSLQAKYFSRYTFTEQQSFCGFAMI